MPALGTVILETAASFAFWSSLYTVFCKRDASKSCEWHCRMVTLIHGIIVVTLTAWCGFVQGPWPFTDPGGPNTALQTFTCTMVLGYFIFDCLWCLYFQTEGAVMLTHHVMSILGNVMVLTRGTNGTEMIAALFGAEFTNPFLQLRWFLRQENKHLTWYGELNDLVFMVLFGLLRIGVGSVLLHSVMIHPDPDFLAKFGGACLYVVSWIFWFAILKYAFKKYSIRYHSWKYRQMKRKRAASCRNSAISDSEDDTVESVSNGPENPGAIASPQKPKTRHRKKQGKNTQTASCDSKDIYFVGQTRGHAGDNNITQRFDEPTTRKHDGCDSNNSEWDATKKKKVPTATLR